MKLLRLRRFDRDVGLVLAAFVLLLAAENLVVGLGWRAQFVGAWEMGSARLYLSPLALTLSWPLAIFIVAAARSVDDGRARRAIGVALLGLVGGGALGFFLSAGRRMASLAVRVPFVAIAALAAAASVYALARLLPRLRPRTLAVLGLTVAALGWTADCFVLPRLYPALHAALLVLTLGGMAATSVIVRVTRAASPVGAFGLLIAAASSLWSPHAVSAVRSADNLRRVLLEHAPLMGRAVAVAAAVEPPPPLEDDAAAITTLTSLRDRKGARALDWQERDIVLVTIDALRADHLSSYGYHRTTTPNIDALAAKGVRFEHAYCPTPHTSYSIASLMTGKYMKPLLALADEAVSADASDTWAVQLRRYGYRTAAFYPPAVFFIDEHRFRRMHAENLGFEYKKEEFAPPELRRAQIERYLTSAPKDRPLFLWVHLFEPHEPYQLHPEHPFDGDPKFDAYDSEIATADALVGDITRLVGEKRPPGAVFIVSADHGEEHGDHGGRYHGTTVYEEQVRVPLVIVDEGHVAPRVVTQPVQTIDLLPTTLSALDVPLPPRIRGRDLGPVVLGGDKPGEQGLAFAETDDWTLVARGSDRLVCARKIGSCTLFDVAKDPRQQTPVDDPPRVIELKKLLGAIERETGKVEASALPEALRRGLQGDRDAAEDVAPLLDDVRVDIRRAAARCAFRLKAPEMAPQLQRALATDPDEEVRRWSAFALVRMKDASTDARRVTDEAIAGMNGEAATAAAMALAEVGDARGEGHLVRRWNAAFAPGVSRPGELDEARELLGAFVAIQSRAAVPSILASLEDVRLRPHVVAALGAIGDPRARAPVASAFASERYVHLRAAEARALLALGGRSELAAPLARFAGTPEPLADAIAIARDAELLVPEHGGKAWSDAGASRAVTLHAPAIGAARLLVLTGAPAEGGVRGSVAGSAFAVRAPVTAGSSVFAVEVPALPTRAVDLQVESVAGSPVLAVWLVARAAEIPPPPPRAWVPDGKPDADDP